VADESALPAPSHEPTDVSPGVIWIGVPALLAAVVALALLVLGLFPGKAVDRPIHLPLQRFPTPELQVSPREDMAQFRAEQLRWLNGTGWIDKSRGIAHIPIEEAMREVAAEGIEGWPTAVAPLAPSPVTPSPQAAAPPTPRTSGGQP
jgi:hypothetical protein